MGGNGDRLPCGIVVYDAGGAGGEDVGDLVDLLGLHKVFVGLLVEVVDGGLFGGGGDDESAEP